MFLFIWQLQNPASRPGTGTFAYHSLEILVICLGMFLFGWLLRHLIYGTRQKERIAELEGQLSSARTRISDLEGDLEGCNSAIVNIKGENAALSTKLKKLKKSKQITEEPSADVGMRELSELETSTSALEETLVSGLASDIVGNTGAGYDVKGAKAVFGKTVIEDDLRIVEGIGPKTAALLNVSSIHTWRQLGSTSVPQLQNILRRAGDRFQFLNPSTWPKQARMASEGEWVKLREYQDYLVGGVEPPDKSPPTISDDTPASYVLGRKVTQDDLTVVEGIGPKIQELLHQNGIDTWQKLGETTEDELQHMLDSAGDRYRMQNPATWSQQATMAADSKWDELKEYQEFLKRGGETEDDN